MIFQLPQLLTASAARHPGSDAVRHGDARVTYAELDERSGRLAATLVDLGVRRGDRVGFFFPKSIPSIVTIFGILKAGGVYVPIDPASPAERVAYVARNCGIRHLVTLRERLPLLEVAFAAGAPGELEAVILVDEVPAADEAHTPRCATQLMEWCRVLDHSAIQADLGVDSDLAYILYTSGSTGEPKGVMISHRAALTFIEWTRAEFDVTSRDIVSSHAPLHFDLSILDVFTTIAAGATIVLVPDRLSTFPVRLAEFIRTQRISVWYSVPSALTLMLQRGKFADFPYPDLRVLLFAGEVFPIKFVQQLRRAVTARLCNLYGPTETNVCTWYEVTERDLSREVPLPIGKAITNYDVFAVSPEGARVGAGEGEGELFARGPGLMSGYWGDRERSERVLRLNPVTSHLPVERVMATGDIVTVDEHGDFLFVGRRDSMIKSRGYRIELGEVEAALLRCPGVREAGVVAVPDPLLTNRLKAFISAEETVTLATPAVLEFLRSVLPPYMVPEHIEIMAELPKTSTGKLDRQTLARS